jgi:hypothetical protein
VLCWLQALRDAHQQAVQRAEAGAVRALAALAHPAWGDAVVGAAAAIASEAAVGACTRRLIAEVRWLRPSFLAVGGSRPEEMSRR